MPCCSPQGLGKWGEMGDYISYVRSGQSLVAAVLLNAAACTYVGKQLA
jgi:hypothetical protein